MYLIQQIAFFLVAAGLIGGLAGWFARGGREGPADALSIARDAHAAAERQNAALRAEIAALRETGATLSLVQGGETADARIAALEADLERANAAGEARLDQAREDLAACRRRAEALEAELSRLRSPAPALSPTPASPTPEQEPPAAATSPLARYSPEALEAAVMAAGEGVRPAPLAAPEGAPDDLKAIAGVGPQLEAWLNAQGIYHYRQIARLQASGVAWLARNLPNFGSRVYRENWVEQAARLAAEARDKI
jgi:predicted flap endonuclease-1-like 5' DNA nuclease